MRTTRRRVLGLGLLAALPIGLIRLISPTRAAAEAGMVAGLKGEAAASLNEMPRALKKGAPIYQGDHLTTAANSALEILFLDDTRFELGANASLTVDEFIYNPATDTGSLATNILTGSFRFATGKIARKRPQALTVKMPAGTIGVRGTRVGGMTDGYRAEVVLLEPEVDGPTAIEVANQHGSVIVDKPGWGTEIPSPNDPPTPPQRWGQQRLNSILRSFRAMRRMNMPRPRIRQ